MVQVFRVEGSTKGFLEECYKVASLGPFRLCRLGLTVRGLGFLHREGLLFRGTGFENRLVDSGVEESNSSLGV